MANAVTQEIATICRFCLCEEEEYLIPIEDLLDCEITIEDLVRFSGIEINDENMATYLVCMECASKLKESTTFRNTCLKNDSIFRDLRALLVASGKEILQEIVDSIELSDSDEDIGTKPVVVYLNDPFWKPPKQIAAISPVPKTPILCPEVTHDVDDEDTQHSEAFSSTSITKAEMACDDELFAYSANYIEPGEILFDADEMQKLFLAWDGSFNPPPPRYPDVSYQRKRGRRKLLLCELCGKTVVDITRHYENHSEPTYSCPHCPVKMKQKSNITNHVLQVHLRKPSRTCKICGIGFIHHKTYRYHMLTHEGEGKTFECKDCSKTFPNAIYLRDHFNRLHNIVKTVRKAEPGDKVRRKRNRSQIIAV